MLHLMMPSQNGLRNQLWMLLRKQGMDVLDAGFRAMAESSSLHSTDLSKALPEVDENLASGQLEASVAPGTIIGMVLLQYLDVIGLLRSNCVFCSSSIVGCYQKTRFRRFMEVLCICIAVQLFKQMHMYWWLEICP